MTSSFGTSIKRSILDYLSALGGRSSHVFARYASHCMARNKHHDYYKVLEVDYDATDEAIRLNYRRLALKWHPDKQKGNSCVSAKFQEINEAYKVLSDPARRLDYDISGTYEINKYTLREYLTRFKGMILTCNGLGISHSSRRSQQLLETEWFDW